MARERRRSRWDDMWKPLRQLLGGRAVAHLFVIRARLRVLALAAAVLLVAGCGGSSSKSASSSARTSPSTATTAVHIASSSASTSQPAPATTPGHTSNVVSKADAICMRRNAEVKAVSNTAKIFTNAEIARLAAKEIPIESAAVTELRRLAPPASAPGDWRKLLAYRQMIAEALTKLDPDATRNDDQAVTAVANATNETVAQLLLTASDGFRHCGVIESFH